MGGMNKRRILIVVAGLSCAGALVAAAIGVSTATIDGADGPTLAFGAALAFAAVTITSMAALYLVDQRRTAARLREVQRDVRRNTDEIRSTLRHLRQPLEAASKAVSRPMLDRRLADTSFQLYRQLEARFVLERLLEPARPLPPLRGWALSPDIAVELVERVLARQARRILETGSGVSTLLFALAIQKSGGDGQVVALEHDEQWAQHTRRLLEDHGCSDIAEVVHAPLTHVLVDEDSYDWYQPEMVAAVPTEVDLLLIDGPPASTGPRSRFPALPLLRHTLAPNARVFLDDANRDDEQAIVNDWIERYGVEMVAMHRHEKGSAELRIVRTA
jgi:predicted O-methyltransferase YrrM